MVQIAVEGLISDFKTLEIKPSFSSAPAEVHMLPMPDGVLLSTTIQKPAGSGPFPTIVLRSCYPLQEPLYKVYANEYCSRGFAFVYQFCRGTGGSQGEWVPNIHDRQDGKETLDWLAGQDWVENIGYWGSSYLAFTGWIMADIIPEKVKTLYLTHYGTDRFTSAYQNGLFRQDVLTAWAMENAGFEVTADYLESAAYRPQVEVDEALWGQRLDWYRDWITNTNRSDPYWNSGFWKALKDIPGKVKVPVYIGEGWYDHHLGSALVTWEDLSPQAKAHSVLRIGAWNHGFLPCVQGTVCNNLQNKDALTAFHWFDNILRKKEKPKGKIITYRIGEDDWSEQAQYPFKQENQKVFYLSAQSSKKNVYCLREEITEEETSLEFCYDPDKPLPSHGAESLLRTFEEIGSLLQPQAGWREDVLCFLSEEMEEDLNILGKIKVRLYVSSSAEDTSFTAKLMEVYADGKAYNIRSGITTLAYRNSPDQNRQSYTPGEVVEAVIDFWDISWKLHKGSRLRIDIGSSDFPQYALHTNTPGVWAEQEKARPANQTLFFGPACPAHVFLPLDQPAK